MGASSTWYVADCLRLGPRVVNRVKHLYLWAVQFTVGVVRPCSITTTAEYVHFVADAGCRVKVPPSRRLTTLNTTTNYKGSNPQQIPHLHAMITGCFYYCNHFCLIAIFPGKPASAGFPLARSTQPVPVRQPQGINAVDSNFMKWYCSQIIGTFIYTLLFTWLPSKSASKMFSKLPTFAHESTFLSQNQNCSLAMTRTKMNAIVHLCRSLVIMAKTHWHIYW